MIGLLRKALGRSHQNYPAVGQLSGISDAVGRKLDTMLQTKQFCRLLRKDSTENLDTRVRSIAWMVLESEMALVPCHLPAPAGADQAADKSPQVEAMYLDRYAVSNVDYLHFVEQGGYTRPDYWPEEMWSNVLQFVDQTGQPGPRFWRNGKPRKQDLKLPVVGVCWYEANAYAAWAGKTLCSSQEWQHACSWCASEADSASRVRYPWGTTLDASMANTWKAGIGRPVPVNSYYSGATPNGVYQLIGNVWEWTGTPYRCGTTRQDVTIFLDCPMAELRGGAFDTYFEDQATATFRTGASYLSRKPNIGFRCCVQRALLISGLDSNGFEDI